MTESYVPGSAGGDGLATPPEDSASGMANTPVDGIPAAGSLFMPGDPVPELAPPRPLTDEELLPPPPVPAPASPGAVGELGSIEGMGVAPFATELRDPPAPEPVMHLKYMEPGLGGPGLPEIGIVAAPGSPGTAGNPAAGQPIAPTSLDDGTRKPVRFSATRRVIAIGITLLTIGFVLYRLWDAFSYIGAGALRPWGMIPFLVTLVLGGLLAGFTLYTWRWANRPI